MPDYNSQGECSCCLFCSCIIFTLGLTAFSIWLTLHNASSPTISIESFDAFALNITAFPNSTTASNHTIYYDLKLNNKEKDLGVYYDALNLTFYYAAKPINNTSYPAFYQGHGKNTHRKASFDATPAGVNWESAAADVRVNKTAVFRVELATAVRFKDMFFKTKRRRLVIRADLKVNEKGILVRSKKKGIKLSSGAAKINKGWFDWVGILGIWGFVIFCRL